MLLAIGLLFSDAIHCLEDLFNEQPVAIQHRMEQGQALGMRLRNALIQAHRGYLHQQRGLLVLIGQVEIMAHHRLYDESPVQMIGPRNGAPRHQMVFLATDHHRLGQIVSLRIGIEESRLQVDARLWVGTHIYRPVQSRLQEFDVKAKLVLIGSSRSIV